MNQKRKFARIFIGILILPFLIGFSVNEVSYSVIPLWTQQTSWLSCFPSDDPIKPVPAFLSGMRYKIERGK